MTTYTRKNKGTCSQSTTVTLADDGTIQELNVQGGCNGNLQGISKLVEGMSAEDAISRLKGIKCGFKPTSCPDQLAKAIDEVL